jgi:hypothetical protein
MAEYTTGVLLETVTKTAATREDPNRKAILMSVFNISQETPVPAEYVDYPREYPLEISWTKINPKK